MEAQIKQLPIPLILFTQVLLCTPRRGYKNIQDKSNVYSGSLSPVNPARSIGPFLVGNNVLLTCTDPNPREAAERKPSQDTWGSAAMRPTVLQGERN